jgi:hypothetical protein
MTATSEAADCLTRSAIEGAIQSLGFVPSSSDNENISFAVGSVAYHVIANQAAGYLRVTLPSFYSRVDAPDQLKLMQAMLDITRDIRVAKLFFHEGTVWAAYEGYVLRSEDIKGFIKSGIDHLNAAAVRFFQAVGDGSKK